MSVRTFLFCDVCNPRGIRIPEQRRDMHRREHPGRRITDGRSWFEGTLTQAVNEHQWITDGNGSYVCPTCAARGLRADSRNSGSKSGLRRFVFCDLCNPQGIRVVEIRRTAVRPDASQMGRRITDGRSWTTPEHMLEMNWIVTEEGKHYCPKCVQHHPALTAQVTG